MFLRFVQLVHPSLDFSWQPPDRRYLPIHAVCSLCIALPGMKTQRYHNWPLAEHLLSSAWQFLHIRNTWVSMVSTRVQDCVQNSQTCGFWCPVLKRLYLHKAVLTMQSSCTLYQHSPSLTNKVYFLWASSLTCTIMYVHDQQEEFTWLPVASTLYVGNSSPNIP